MKRLFIFSALIIGNSLMCMQLSIDQPTLLSWLESSKNNIAFTLFDTETSTYTELDANLLLDEANNNDISYHDKAKKVIATLLLDSYVTFNYNKLLILLNYKAIAPVLGNYILEARRLQGISNLAENDSRQSGLSQLGAFVSGAFVGGVFCVAAYHYINYQR